MSHIPNKSPLYDYIRDILKNTNVETPQVEWSEIEVLLVQKQTKMPLPDKRYVLLGAGVVALIVSVFFIVRSFHSSTVTIESGQTTADTTVLNPTNEYTASITPITSIDTTAVQATDSLHSEEKSILSSTVPTPTIAPISPSSNVFTNTTHSTTQQLNNPLKIAKKKSKLSSLAPTILDTGYIPENLPPPDTGGKYIPVEIISTPSSLPADSVKNSSRKKNSRNKKTKSSKSATSEQPATSSPLPIKKDSL